MVRYIAGLFCVVIPGVSVWGDPAEERTKSEEEAHEYQTHIEMHRNT